MYSALLSSIRAKVKEYFTVNMNSVSSIQIVWEIFKVTCRGWIISYLTAKKREKNEGKFPKRRIEQA